jgi:hypothetical protein
MPVGFPPISRTGIYLSYNKKRRLTLMNTRKLHHQHDNPIISRIFRSFNNVYVNLMFTSTFNYDWSFCIAIVNAVKLKLNHIRATMS